MNFFPAPVNSYKPSKGIDPEFLRQFAAIANAHYEKQGTSAATDPISLSGSSSSRGGVGDEVKISTKSVSANDVKKQLTTKEFRPTFNLAKGELNQLTAKCTALRSELSKVTNELDKEQRKEKMDPAKIADLTTKQTKLEEQIELIEKAIKGYRTLTEQGVSGITGENGKDLMTKNQEAFDAIGNLTDQSLADLGLQTGNLNQVAKKAFEYKQQKIADLSEECDAEDIKDSKKRAEATSGSTASKPSKDSQHAMKAAERQLARAEKTGNVDGQIKAQEDIVATLEQQIKENEEKREAERKAINDKIDILVYITHSKQIVMSNAGENEITKDDFIKLLDKYPNGFELKSADGTKTIKVTAQQIAAAKASINAWANSGCVKGGTYTGDVIDAIADIQTKNLSEYERVLWGSNGQYCKELNNKGAHKEDRYMYYRLKEMSDEQILELVRIGNLDRSQYNFNNLVAGHTDQSLVESLYDCDDSNLTIGYLYARLAKIKQNKGLELSGKERKAVSKLDEGGDNFEDLKPEFRYEGDYQKLLYGTSDYGAGIGDGLVSQLLDNGKVPNRGNMPKIELPNDFQWTVQYYDETFKKHVNQPNAELAEKLKAAKAKLEELKAKKDAAPAEQPTPEPAVQPMTDEQITQKALEIIKDAKIDTTKDGWKELAKAEVDKLDLQDSVKKQLKAVIDGIRVEVKPDTETPTAEQTPTVTTTPEQLATTFGNAVLNTNMTREQLFPLVNSASNMVVNTSYTLNPNTVFRSLPQANQNAVLNTNLGYGTLFGSGFLTATDKSASAEQKKAYADAVTDVLKNQFRFAQIMSSPADHKFTKEEIIAMRNFLKAEYVGDGMNPEHKTGIAFLIDNCAQLTPAEKTEFKKLLEE